MKKLCVLLCSYLICCFSCSVNFLHAKNYNQVINSNANNSLNLFSAETTTYAKALVGCTLYKSRSMSNELENIYFIIPETYFVVVLESISDVCLKVQYNKYIGYVNITTVTIATFIPIVKTLDNIKCDIKGTSGTQIWTAPSSSEGKILTTILAGTTGINYIASMYGNIPSGGESNLWYYISYTPDSNSTNVYEGYIYSENVTNLTEIVANTETNPEVINPPDNKEINDTIYVSSTVKTIIIAIIAIPIILLFAILLYKVVKRFKENLNKKHVDSQEIKYLREHNRDQNYDDYVRDYGDTRENENSLHNRLNNMKNTTYIKKERPSIIYPNQSQSSKSSSLNYPKFPSYSSEDDLL